MDKIDEISGLTEKQYRDGLRLAKLARHSAWPVLLAICEEYINDKKDVVFDNLEDQLRGNYDRGCGHGVAELLILLKNQTTQALAQEKRLANSVEGKEDK